MKYNYYIGNNKVVCVSHYAGKAVRGIAKCNKEFDEFNGETGMKLAKMRCDTKIALKRIDHTVKKLSLAIDEMVTAQNNVDNLSKLLDRSNEEYADLSQRLVALEEELAKVIS